ncbi:MAG: FAD-dependent oxidoreductase, partial [Gammaproteobacteria bacterium]|nr:FAD-dependent oxidoreductase [Gammaproteobacteria bacterium]
RNNPFPAIAGRICHHPCEAACNRVGYDAPVSICRLERAVGDAAIEAGWRHAAAARQRSERVAVVGGGPSGLSAAYQLRRMGYPVTLIEAHAELGGLMRHGIPAYRLARAVLDAEIRPILDMGLELRLATRLDTPAAWQALRATHAALYIATGAQRQKRLPALDYQRPWVLDGAAYLAAANAGRPPSLGRRLVVIGGGSAALDAARSARRAGHEVTLLSLEARAQLAAQPEEVEEALEEGVVLQAGVMLQRAEERSGEVRLRCTRVRFEPGARRGEFTVVPLEDGAFELAADALLTSIGQDPDLAALGAAYPVRGALLAVDEHQASSVEGVWAGGDVASLARFVTEAVGQGRRAAYDIDRQLRARAGELPGVQHDGPGAPPARTVGREAPVPLTAIATFYHPRRARAAERRLDPSTRLARDAEVQLALDDAAVLAEAARCFSCGTCIRCDNCVVVCPDLAVRRIADGYQVLGDYCKGCGLCVRECPTGSMDMVEEAR